MKTTRKNNAGAALLLVTIVIMAGSLVIGALTLRAVQHQENIAKAKQFKDCYEGVEAAIAMATAEINNGEDGMVGVSPSFTPAADENGKFILPSFDDPGVTPLTLNMMPNIDFFAVSLDWAVDNIDNNGDGNIDDAGEIDTVSVYAFARSDSAVRRVEVILRASTGETTNDTIFAGGGQAGALINGNVDIHGSVHLLGDDLPEGGAALIAMDLSGTTLISNNYENLDPAIAALIPVLPTTDFNGETVESLEAKLRVRNGLVSMSGNSHIGDEDDPGDGDKETMDGTFVTDGWTGNSVTDDGNRGDPTNVYSDNGWDEKYDLGPGISFPELGDDWEWTDVNPLDMPQLPDQYGGVVPPKGSTELNPDTSANYTFEDFFTEVLSDGQLDHGDIEINTQEKFYWNSTQESDTSNGYFNEQDPGNSSMSEADFDNLDPSTFDPTEDYIYFDPSSDTIYWNGQIDINGSLAFTPKGGDDTIQYVGRAAILTQGDITLDTNLLVANTHGNASYPENNIISMMTKNNLNVGTTSQLTLMGAFYASNEIISNKQTTTVGMFVSNFFDMGNQVPAIYGVPELRSNLPFGTNFEIQIEIFNVRAWRELGAPFAFEAADAASSST